MSGTAVNLAGNPVVDTGAPPGTAAYLATLTKGTPEYEAAAAELYNGRHNPASPLSPETPEGVPEKFFDKESGQVNVAALLASYKALEAKLGAPAPANDQTAPAAGAEPTAAPTDPAAAPKLEIPAGSVDPVADLVTAAGLNVDALGAKIMKTGKLDDTDYAAIEKLGIPRPLIDQHVNAMKQLGEITQAENTRQAVAMFGNEAAMDATLKWAAATYTEAEQARLNAKLNSADWRDAVKVLRSDYMAANPGASEPTLRTGGGGNNQVEQGYRAKQDWVRDMQRPEYKKDAAFRAKVAARHAVSTWDLDR